MLTYAGRDDELRPWFNNGPHRAQINRDVNMRLQYLAGWGLNYNHADVIYSQIRSYRTVPADLFVGKPASVDLFRRALLGQLP